ncbi:MAG: hypothetical protein ACQER9_01540 [Nanobdellota archaeon]
MKLNYLFLILTVMLLTGCSTQEVMINKSEQEVTEKVSYEEHEEINDSLEEITVEIFNGKIYPSDIKIDDKTNLAIYNRMDNKTRVDIPSNHVTIDIEADSYDIIQVEESGIIEINGIEVGNIEQS